ncbi:MAG TPA: DegT/DnrJ/EryC1/StrS family aminotransferase [Phycisphaerae bacterium]|nr:DegT/DnrJ/EryC1/StrS family aminotransferase [Phycisphaerae bacterium]
MQWPNEFPGVYWLDDKEATAVLDVVKNGSLFRYYGLKAPKYVDKYESLSKEYYGCKYTLGINSGTGALSTALSALQIGPGCEVIVPAFLWVATVGAVVQANAIPVICEVDESFTMDPIDLEKKITPNTKLIIPIHMAGSPCNMEAIMKIARKHKIAVLEDCAQCNGGEFKGQKVGTFGDMGIFSLQLNKNMTCGEGGLIITNDEKLYYRAFAAHDMGLIRVNGRLATPPEYALSWGQGRRMSELCGSVASEQIQKLPQITQKMRESKNRIKNLLKNVSRLSFRKLTDVEGDSGPFMIIMLENAAKALSAVEKMKQAGLHNVFRLADYGLHVYSNILSLVNKVPLSPAGNPWKLCENQKSDYSYAKGACPKSDELFAKSILIPIPSCLSEQQEAEAAEIIRQAMK